MTGGLFLRSLGTVFGTGLFSVGNACRIQRSTDDVISGTGQVLYSSSADQHHAVLLKIVSFSGTIAGNLNAVGKTDSGDLSQS